MANVSANSIANLKPFGRESHPDWSRMLQTRNRLVRSAIRELYRDFRTNHQGYKAIVRMREEHPDKYVLAIIGLAPKNLDISGEIQHMHLHAAISDPTAWVTAIVQGTTLVLDSMAEIVEPEEHETA